MKCLWYYSPVASTTPPSLKPPEEDIWPSKGSKTASPMGCALRICDPMDWGYSVHRIFPGKNIGTGCHFLLHGIFPTQGSNLFLFHLLHWQVDSLSLRHLGSPWNWSIKMQKDSRRQNCKVTQRWGWSQWSGKSKLCGKQGCIFRGRGVHWLGIQTVEVSCLVWIMAPTYQPQDFGEVASPLRDSVFSSVKCENKQYSTPCTTVIIKWTNTHQGRNVGIPHMLGTARCH